VLTILATAALADQLDLRVASRGVAAVQVAKPAGAAALGDQLVVPVQDDIATSPTSQ
jgi:hypothetical protein